MGSKVITNPRISVATATGKKLDGLLRKAPDSIVAVSRLHRLWSNGEVKKDLVFEQDNGKITSKVQKPETEPTPFQQDRWNIFNGFCVASDQVLKHIPKNVLNDQTRLLAYCLEKKIPLLIAPDTFATEKPVSGLVDFLQPRKIASAHKRLRDILLFFKIILDKTISIFSTSASRRAYLTQIHKIKYQKKIVLDLSFGGVGDCLSFSSLPRLLKEQFDIDFYLSENSRRVFAHNDIFKLCFETNPYFKGFSGENDVFRIKNFVHDQSLLTFLTDKGGPTVLEQLEEQFGLLGIGLPEIFYKPKHIPGLEKTLFCDLNWYSGEKWGLHNDQIIIDDIITTWKSQGPEYQVKHNDTSEQNIFEYIDIINSCSQFLCLFSGGNPIATALGTPAIVIVPENLEGNSLSMFLFKKSKNSYVRKASLAGYGIK